MRIFRFAREVISLRENRLHSQRISHGSYRIVKYAHGWKGYEIAPHLGVVSRMIEEESDGGGRNVKEDVERIFLDKWLSRPKRKRRERAEKDECTRSSVEWPFYRHEMHFLWDTLFAGRV